MLEWEDREDRLERVDGGRGVNDNRLTVKRAVRIDKSVSC